MKNKEEILLNIKSKALEDHVPILQDASLEAILMILKIAKPNQILEIGTAVGYSAIEFSKYLVGENSKIKTIEINENMYDQAVQNVSDMELTDKIEIVHANATEYLKEMNEEEQYDIVFIDAAKGQYLVFLEHALRLVKNGGIIIADNVFFNGRVLSGYNEHRHRTATNRMKEYIRIVTEDTRMDSNILHIGDGIAVSIVKK